jgi:uncharacterized protein (DUF302 family)
MQEGIQSCTSVASVEETLKRLTALLVEPEMKQRGMRIFCVIDHSGEAKAAGMSMPETKVVIFGIPKAGTPLMQAAPSLALDLPLKLLIAEQHDGRALLSWNDPRWLQLRHGLPEEKTAAIAGVERLARMAAGRP